MTSHPLQRVGQLWQVESGDNRLSCGVYRDAEGSTLLRLESPGAVIMSLPFGFEPRMLARARAIHASLLRRGWSNVQGGETGSGERSGES